MRRNGSFAALVFIVILGIGAALAYAMYRVSGSLDALGILGCAFLLASVCLFRNSGRGSMEQGRGPAAW